jgi:programmed cell death 8 (apoptosis-inducing factor)
MRPPLSKEMISDPEKRSLERLVFKQWNGTERSLFFEPEEFFVPCKELPTAEYGGVAVARGWTVKELDVRKQTATLDDGKVIKFEKCLIATGASPKNLPIFSEVSPELKEKITLFRNLRDLQCVERILEEGAKKVAVVGNGFLGSEIAVGLAGRGVKVTQLFKEEMPLSKILPPYLSHWTMSKMEKEGVALMPNTEIHQVCFTLY